MERTEVYKLKLKSFQEALESFKNLLSKDISNLDDVLKDGIRNGRIQKFEYCFEMLWKLIKRFLLIQDGIETTSPKGTIKEFFLNKYISNEQYELLIQMLDDRNTMSHVYDESSFRQLNRNLEQYAALMVDLTKILS